MVEEGTKVDVFMNLQHSCISVRSRETHNYGKVIAHEQEVFIEDAEFVVQPAGRERVREEGVKNVHAFVRGRVSTEEKSLSGETEPIMYNPYEYDNFVNAETEEPVDESSLVKVSTNGVEAET